MSADGTTVDSMEDGGYIGRLNKISSSLGHNMAESIIFLREQCCKHL